MSHKHRVLSQLLVVLLLLVATAAVVLAHSSAGFDLRWNVIDNGGGVSNSASYRVRGTIGQSISGSFAADSASFTVSSGYGTAAGLRTTIYLPIVLKSQF